MAELLLPPGLLPLRAEEQKIDADGCRGPGMKVNRSSPRRRGVRHNDNSPPSCSGPPSSSCSPALHSLASTTSPQMGPGHASAAFLSDSTSNEEPPAAIEDYLDDPIAAPTEDYHLETSEQDVAVRLPPVVQELTEFEDEAGGADEPAPSRSKPLASQILEEAMARLSLRCGGEAPSTSHGEAPVLQGQFRTSCRPSAGGAPDTHQRQLQHTLKNIFPDAFPGALAFRSESEMLPVAPPGLERRAVLRESQEVHLAHDDDPHRAPTEGAVRPKQVEVDLGGEDLHLQLDDQDQQEAAPPAPISGTQAAPAVLSFVGNNASLAAYKGLLHGDPALIHLGRTCSELHSATTAQLDELYGTAAGHFENALENFDQLGDPVTFGPQASGHPHDIHVHALEGSYREFDWFWKQVPNEVRTTLYRGRGRDEDELQYHSHGFFLDVSTFPSGQESGQDWYRYQDDCLLPKTSYEDRDGFVALRACRPVAESVIAEHLGMRRDRVSRLFGAVTPAQAERAAQEGQDLYPPFELKFVAAVPARLTDGRGANLKNSTSTFLPGEMSPAKLLPYAMKGREASDAMFGRDEEEGGVAPPSRPRVQLPVVDVYSATDLIRMLLRQTSVFAHLLPGRHSSETLVPHGLQFPDGHNILKTVARVWRKMVSKPSRSGGPSEWEIVKDGTDCAHYKANPTGPREAEGDDEEEERVPSCETYEEPEIARRFFSPSSGTRTTPAMGPAARQQPSSWEIYQFRHGQTTPAEWSQFQKRSLPRDPRAAFPFAHGAHSRSHNAQEGPFIYAKPVGTVPPPPEYRFLEVLFAPKHELDEAWRNAEENIGGGGRDRESPTSSLLAAKRFHPQSFFWHVENRLKSQKQKSFIHLQLKTAETDKRNSRGYVRGGYNPAHREDRGRKLLFGLRFVYREVEVRMFEAAAAGGPGAGATTPEPAAAPARASRKRLVLVAVLATYTRGGRGTAGSSVVLQRKGAAGVPWSTTLESVHRDPLHGAPPNEGGVLRPTDAEGGGSTATEGGASPNRRSLLPQLVAGDIACCDEEEDGSRGQDAYRLVPDGRGGWRMAQVGEAHFLRRIADANQGQPGWNISNWCPCRRRRQ